MNRSEKIDHACSLIEAGNFRDAFRSLTELYGDSKDKAERAMLFHLLQEGYYLPNEEALQKNYAENCTLLESYPFQLGFQKCPFGDLPIQLFPVTEQEYCLYYKKRAEFSGLNVIESEDLTDYLFSDLSQPVFRENDCNLYHLKYLQDNVRRSEDYGGDNHIYLYYSDQEQLLPLLLLGELKPLLQEQKFVFLIGHKNKKYYPLDFKKQFQIDYEVMEPQKLRVNEMRRICFWYKRGYSGSSFGVDVLDHNRYIVGIESVELFYESYIHGHPIFQTDLPEKLLQNTTKKYSVKDIEVLYHHPGIQWGISDMGDFIDWLKKSQYDQFTLPELFRIYFIYKYHRDKSDMNPRIVPMILWEPHLNAVDIHNPLILGFQYIFVLNTFRDPVQTVGRIYQREGSIFIPQVMWIGYSMHPELRKHYYSYRFEDLKLHPKETCKALCEVLNVPYDPNMLNSDITEQGINGEAAVRGFDLTPLNRNIDSAYSQFDQVRLRIFYDAILRHYDYPTFDFDECPMNDDDVAFLIKFPFKYEKDYVAKGKWEKTTREQLRERLFQNMMAAWQMGKQKNWFFRTLFSRN